MSQLRPRFHTPRDERYRTIGPNIAKALKVFGKTPIPWQRRALDVLGEVDDSGKLRYDRVLITVPRQAGKTTVSLGTGFHRALWLPSAKIWYTAQTGSTARERFLDEIGRPAVAALPSLVNLNSGAGNTRLSIPATGSQIRPHPPTEEYLHSEQSDLNIIDEPWVFNEIEARALMQAIVPTQNSRPNSQIIMLSTAGTADSTWWHRQVDEARAGKPGTCIIDYGVPLDEDPTSIDNVIKYHPAIGHLTSAKKIHAAYEQLDSPAEFARGYGNVPTLGKVATFKDEEISACHCDIRIPDSAKVHIGLAFDRDMRQAAIVAAAMVDGVPTIEVIDARPGTKWVPRIAAAIAARQRCPVAIDSATPAANLVPELEGLGVEVISPTARDLSNTVASIYRGIKDAAIHFREDQELFTELRGIKTRPMGDSGIMWSRRHSATGIARVEAATLAHWAATNVTESPEPKIWML